MTAQQMNPDDNRRPSKGPGDEMLSLQEACAYIENNPEEVAALLCENEGVDEATMLSWLQDPACGYATETVGVLSMAQFMAENGFLDVAPQSFSDLAFENVLGN